MCIKKVVFTDAPHVASCFHPASARPHGSGWMTTVWRHVEINNIPNLRFRKERLW